jgi:NADPH:quinone reductase-like Zn-dependent oxidoreductase
MLVAGVRTLDGKVETLEVDEPRPLAADEVLIDVRDAGVNNWDNIIRTGGWDVGTNPPLALGVEAAGVIKAIGAGPSGFDVDDEVLCHPVPLRDQGTWAPSVIAPVGSLAQHANRNRYPVDIHRDAPVRPRMVFGARPSSGRV